MSASADRWSFGRALRGIVEDLTSLIRAEFELAKIEIREALVRMGGGGALLAAACLLGLAGCGFLLVTVTVLLSRIMPLWGATLAVGAALLLGAGATAVIGRNRLRGVDFRPRSAMRNVRRDLEVIRSARATEGGEAE